MKRIGQIQKFGRGQLRILIEVKNPVTMEFGDVLFKSSNLSPLKHDGQCKKFARENGIAILPHN